MADLDPSVVALMAEFARTLQLADAVNEISQRDEPRCCGAEATYRIEVPCQHCTKVETKVVCEEHFDRVTRLYLAHLFAEDGTDHDVRHAYSRVTTGFISAQ